MDHLAWKYTMTLRGQNQTLVASIIRHIKANGENLLFVFKSGLQIHCVASICVWKKQMCVKSLTFNYQNKIKTTHWLLLFPFQHSECLFKPLFYNFNFGVKIVSTNPTEILFKNFPSLHLSFEACDCFPTLLNVLSSEKYLIFNSATFNLSSENM